MITCTKCEKREAVVNLKYDNSDLCKPCFLNQFENRVYRANKEFKLIQHGDKVAVGVSGGKDSAALLYVLNKLAKHMQAELVPILVDEGIQGYRDEATKKALELCKIIGLPLTIVNYSDLFGITIDQANKNKAKLEWRGSCTYCGVFRKTALNKAAYNLQCTKVAVGHNADDIAQTVLMNFMRNEPARFLRFGATGGVIERDKFVMRIKPLIYNTEKECALYCALHELPFHLAECPYSSDSFRGEVKNFLNAVEAKHAGTKFNIVRSFLSMKELVGDGKVKERDLQHCEKCSEPCGGNICKACQFKQELSFQRM